ncbi:MAG: hypothetical protein PHC88_12495 [Terrimicrobiaceae bacterium]|nr:hypothetical protein [Terrimicrobiaceae bacterium]
MNNKHIACLAILFFCVVVAQGVSAVRLRATSMQTAAQLARQDADTASVSLQAQRAILDDLKHKSADLLDYLDVWEPHLSRLATPESGEINVNALVKEAGLILLAQRFEVVPNKSGASVPNATDATIPQFVRAHLTVEDDFIKTINWLGDLESKLPSARVSSLALARGQSGNDLRMDLVVDVPLAVPRATPSPTP